MLYEHGERGGQTLRLDRREDAVSPSADDIVVRRGGGGVPSVEEEYDGVADPA